MKSNLNLLLFLILSLFCVQNIFGQDRIQKTIVILDSLKAVDDIKKTYIDYRVKLLYFEASKQDSVKLVKIENDLTDAEIQKRIIIAFDNLYSNSEIDDLYNFIKTTAFTKFISFAKMAETIFAQFKDISVELDKIESNIGKQNNNNQEISPQFKPIPTDREDGFYETMNYDSIQDLQDIQLVDTSSISIKEISDFEKKTNNFGDSYIEVTFTKNGAKLFYSLTRRNLARPIAIVINKFIVSLPIVQSAIAGGKAAIGGDFTPEEFDQMIERLKTK